MMEVVIVDDGNRLTVYELVERVIPCIIAKHYSENYIQGFRSTFRNLLAYCNKNEKKYFTADWLSSSCWIATVCSREQ